MNKEDKKTVFCVTHFGSTNASVQSDLLANQTALAGYSTQVSFAEVIHYFYILASGLASVSAVKMSKSVLCLVLSVLK